MSRPPMKKRSRSTSVELPTQRPSTDPVSAYAWDVLKGKIVAGRLVRFACERHFRDLRDGHKRGLAWNPEAAQHAIDFNRFLRHSKGEWAGQPIILSPWQQFIHGSVFGWMRADGLRRFRVAYLELGRKNGKSTVAAAVALQGLMGDKEPGSEVFSAATKRDQARLVFDEARRMVLGSPRLKSSVRVLQRVLVHEPSGSNFIPLSSDERTLDGLNPHFVIIDELHRHKSRAVLDVLDTAMGSRRQPLLWIITTAGSSDTQTVYAAETTYAAQVLDGSVKDDSYFAYIATLDPEDRWDDPKVWIKANPNLGISVKMDDLRRQALKASRSPPSLIAFKRLRLNMRTSDSAQAIDMAVWRKNSGGPFDPAELQGRPFYGAFDLSSRIDLSAWVKLFPPRDEERTWKVVCRFWMPGDTVQDKSDRDRVQYQRWIDEGLIDATGGNVIDHNEIQRVILEDCRLHEPRAIAYDRWNAVQLAVALENNGLPVFEFAQNVRNYSAPTKQLEAMLLSEQLDHGDNEVLAWMASNLHVVLHENDNLMPSKKNSTSRVDGIVSLIMCIAKSMEDEDIEGIDRFLSGPVTG
jgi:phage terminase large subunit-like protein